MTELDSDNTEKKVENPQCCPCSFVPSVMNTFPYRHTGDKLFSKWMLVKVTLTLYTSFTLIEINMLFEYP